MPGEKEAFWIFVLRDTDTWQSYGLFKDCLNEFIREHSMENVIAILRK